MPCLLLLIGTVLFIVVHGHHLDTYLLKAFVDSGGAEHRSSPGVAYLGLDALNEESAPDNGAFGLPAQQTPRYERRKDLLQNVYALTECASGESQAHLQERETKSNPLRNAPDNAELSNVDNTQSEDMPSTDWRSFGKHNKLPPLPPVAYSNDYYEDLLSSGSEKDDVKRAGPTPVIGCDCKIKNDILDLGHQHFPRYLLNAVCQTDQAPNNEYPQKCWRGSRCKPLEYKVKVLTFRTVIDHAQKDSTLAWLPDDLRQLWKFKTVTVAAGCFCSY